MTTPEMITAKNDLCRTTLVGCKVLITEGVARSTDCEEIISAVRLFNTFNEDNDPQGEHAFGAFDVRRVKYFRKFDYFDKNYEYFQEDELRVLTIMRAEEY